MFVCGCVETSALRITVSITYCINVQDFLESCRAPTLLAELEDDDEMPEPDDDENDDDENEDDDDYEEVMVSRNLLSFMVHTHIIFILNVTLII